MFNRHAARNEFAAKDTPQNDPHIRATEVLQVSRVARPQRFPDEAHSMAKHAVPSRRSMCILGGEFREAPRTGHRPQPVWHAAVSGGLTGQAPCRANYFNSEDICSSVQNASVSRRFSQRQIVPRIVVQIHNGSVKPSNCSSVADVPHSAKKRERERERERGISAAPCDAWRRSPSSIAEPPNEAALDPASENQHAWGRASEDLLDAPRLVANSR